MTGSPAAARFILVVYAMCNVVIVLSDLSKEDDCA